MPEDKATAHPRLGTPVGFVRFATTKKIEIAHALEYGLLNGIRHNQRPWAESREFRVEPSKVTVRPLAVDQRVNDRDNALIQPERVEAN